MPTKLMSVEEAVGIIPDGATVACAGFIGAGHPEALTAAIEELEIKDSPVADPVLEDMKKLRLKLKDELYALLQASKA